MFLKGFLRVLGCNPRKRWVFIRLKIETNKTALFWLLEAQDDVVLEMSFKKNKKSRTLKRHRFGVF